MPQLTDVPCRSPEVHHDRLRRDALATGIDNSLALQRSLGYQFCEQAGSLQACLRYVRYADGRGPLSQALALEYVMSGGLTPNGSVLVST